MNAMKEKLKTWVLLRFQRNNRKPSAAKPYEVDLF